MNSGWIKIHRKTLNSPVWDNHKIFRVWIWCLMKASHKKHTVLIGNQIIELEAGQFVCGRNSAANETGLTPQNIRTSFQTLSKMENLTIKTTNKFSIITIINWDTYQNNVEQLTTKSTNNQPTDNQQITTNKNVKNVKEEKRYTTKPNKDYAKKIHAKENTTKETLRAYLLSKISENGLDKYQEKLIEFFDYRMAMNKKEQYKTEKGIDGLIRESKRCISKFANINDCLDVTMQRNWMTPDPDYLKNRVKPKKQVLR